MFGKPIDLPQWFILLHYVKQIVIRPVFMWSSLTLCLFALSLNSIHKQYDNDPSGSRQSTNVWKIMNYSVTNSDIISLGTFNAMFPALLHIQLILYGTSDKQGGPKTGRFTAVVWPNSRWQKNRQTPGFWCSPLTFAWFIFDVTQFGVWNCFESEDKIWWQ